MLYPSVISERATLNLVLQGGSLARYGDGEFKVCQGFDRKNQIADPVLQRRLREILHDSGDCLVGIPNIRSATPKAAFWRQFLLFATFLTDRQYTSAFISRPDSAPWIDTPDYWDALISLWRGKDVTLVRGSTKSLTAELLQATGAGTVTEVIGPREHAFADYEQLLKRIGTPQIALLCLGLTATVMAVDLCAKGVHAVDLGHVGMFLRKRTRGETVELTAADKVA